MSCPSNRPRYGFEKIAIAEPVKEEPPERDQLAFLLHQVTLLFQRDYIMLVIFLRALAR